MKRLVMIAVMSMTAFFLTACGESSKKPEVSAPQETAAPAAEAAPAPAPAAEEAPTEAAQSDAATQE